MTGPRAGWASPTRCSATSTAPSAPALSSSGRSSADGWFRGFGLKKSLLFLCLCLNVPNVTFLILSQTLPTNYYVIAAIVTFEKLGWGIGCVGHMIYMMQQIAPGPYKTAHYTFATALMGACMMLTGAVSGYLQNWVGYQWFFIIVLFAAAPSILVTIMAPFHNPDSAGRSADDKPGEARAVAA